MQRINALFQTKKYNAQSILMHILFCYNLCYEWGDAKCFVGFSLAVNAATRHHTKFLL